MESEQAIYTLEMMLGSQHHIREILYTDKSNFIYINAKKLVYIEVSQIWNFLTF